MRDLDQKHSQYLIRVDEHDNKTAIFTWTIVLKTPLDQIRVLAVRGIAPRAC